MVPDETDKLIDQSEYFTSKQKAQDIISGSNQCRFCFGENDTEQNPLLSPCKCIGTIHVIHFPCLK